MSNTSGIAVVTSASGVQGRSIVQRLTEAGYEVRGLTRTKKHSPQIEAVGGQPVVVDLSDVTSLAQAFDSAELVVFITPFAHSLRAGEELAVQVAKAAAQAQVKRIIFNCAGEFFEDYDRPVSQILKAMRDRLNTGSVSVITLRPTVYMDNLVAPWAAPAIVNDGIFAYPIESNWSISWISHHTLADFILAAARYQATGNHEFLIGGAEALTADEMSTILSETIGRPVRFVHIALEDFASGLNQAYGVPTGDDLADFYRYLEGHPQALVRDGSAASTLGVTPELFSDWARRQDWAKLGRTS
ncbi:MAG: NmrA family NAD(P)-binding protein [Cyanobacteria bacterium P01_G01_bin.49]